MPGPNLNSTGYIVGFATALCGVCAIFVAASAVGLKDRQEANKLVDRQSKVLAVAGIELDPSASAEDIQATYDANIKAMVVNLKTGQVDSEVDGNGYDQRRASKDPELSTAAPPNKAQVTRVPHQGVVYQVVKGEGDAAKVETIIIPIVGNGLWSTMYGYLALNAKDTNTITGITFYEHGETPGLGGEVENPDWQGKWKGRKAFNDNGEVAVEVIKGAAKSAQDAPYEVDGLTGATITSRGVTATLKFWLGENGYGPYLEQFKRQNKDLRSSL